MPTAVLACYPMNTSIFTLLVAVGFIGASSVRADDAAAIEEIRALHAKIDQGKPTKTETIEFALESDPMEGKITRRSYPDGLVAIKLSYSAGDHSAADENYYYNDKGLFFIFDQASSWQFAPGSTDEKPRTIDTMTETRYYVRAGAVIEVLKRSVTSGEPKQLPALLAKEKNEKAEPGEEGVRLLKRAAALIKIANREEAVKYFTTEP
jgi:hypothetical protein